MEPQINALDTTTAATAIPNDIQRFGTWLSDGWGLFGRVPLKLGLILAAGIPINTLLLFAMPRLLLERQWLSVALTGGIQAVWRHIGPLALMALVLIILVGLAPVTYLLSVLLTGPLMFCVGFAAYRDVGRAR